MPGNRDSGRKKKVAVESNVPEDDVQVEKKKKPGRPKRSENLPASNSVAADVDKELPEPVTESETEMSSSNIRPTSKVTGAYHPVNLQKRHSDINQLYDEYLGVALETFPSSRLPLKRTVLQRYRFLRTESGHTTKVSDIISTITNEVRNLWECGFIPQKNYRGCWDIVQECINSWTSSKQETKINPRFQKNLNTHLDFRPADCQTLASLKQVLEKTNKLNWREDYAFFKGQMKYPQEGTMTAHVDTILKRKIERKSIKDAKAAAYVERNCGESSISQPQGSEGSSSSHTGISSENIIDKSKRQCSLEQVVTRTSDSENEVDVSSDEDWQVPLRKQREMARKPEIVTLNLPAKQIPSILAATMTTTKTSNRNELKIVSTLFKAGGADLNDASISFPTIHRHRKAKVQSDAKEIRETFSSFKEFTNTFLVLHFDGKIIQLFDGKTEDRLAIAVSSPCNLAGQFLASPAISDGTGDTMAKCVYKIVADFNLIETIQALVFDTTASNTGRWKGSSTLLEAMLDRPLLWLACRHHIPELFIKHANIAIRGESKGPEDSLFKEFKKLFGFINLEERTPWKWPSSIRDWRHQRAKEVLIWAENHMEKATWPREDYRELLELVVIFLGGTVKRVHQGEVTVVPVTIRKPGAVHRARFMASCLYLLKISLYQKQFVTDHQNILDALILSEYIALIHAPYFLKSPLAISAPRHDRDLWVDVGKYKKCFRATMRQTEMIEAVQDSIMNHLWYLTEELVVFALFDIQLSEDERRAMAMKLWSIPTPTDFAPGKPIFQEDLMIPDPKLASFVGRKSWLLFNKLNASGHWLQKDVADWENDMEACLKDLKVVNDLAERCIKDIQEYADQARDSQYQEDILIVATDHRGVFQDLRKQALAN